MDRIFLLGGNLVETLAAQTGLSPDQFEVQNQPAIIVKNWDKLPTATQTTILNILTPLMIQAAN